MAITQMDFDDEEEKIIQECSNNWDSNKPKTIRRIIREYGGKN